MSIPKLQIPSSKALPTSTSQANAQRAGRNWELVDGSALELGAWRLGFDTPQITRTVHQLADVRLRRRGLVHHVSVVHDDCHPRRFAVEAAAENTIEKLRVRRRWKNELGLNRPHRLSAADDFP